MVIHKGIIDNLYYADRWVDENGDPLVYTGENYYIYVKEGSAGYNATSEAVHYPDGNSVAIDYTLVQLEAAADLVAANVANGTAVCVLDGNNNPVVYTGADAISLMAAGYDEVGIYLITASILDDVNYEDWVRTAYLRIIKYETTVEWQGYSESELQWKDLSLVAYTYNGIDQVDHIQATIRMRNRDTNSGESVSLTVCTAPTEKYAAGYVANNGVANEFRLAGDYYLSVSFGSAVSSSSRIVRNYSISGATGSVTMNKYFVDITWYINELTDDHIYSEENAPMYDGIEHKIYAVGRGVQYAKYFRNGVQVYASSDISLETDEAEGGIWASTNANPDGFTCRIIEISGEEREKIEAYDSTGVLHKYGSCLYTYNYDLSGSRVLSWIIKKRTLNVTITEGSDVVKKYYDGNESYIFQSSAENIETHYTQKYDENGEAMVISRSGQVIHVYDQSGRAAIDGFIEDYNSISYVIEGVLENDIGSQFVCEKCGFVYITTKANSYTFDEDDESFVKVLITNGTLWGDVPDTFECPQCKKIAAAKAETVINGLDDLTYREVLSDSSVAFIRSVEILESLYANAYTMYTNSNFVQAYIMCQAAYELYQQFDADMQSICTHGAFDILSLWYDNVVCMYSEFESELYEFFSEQEGSITRGKRHQYFYTSRYLEMADMFSRLASLMQQYSSSDPHYEDYQEYIFNLTSEARNDTLISFLKNVWDDVYSLYFNDYFAEHPSLSQQEQADYIAEHRSDYEPSAASFVYNCLSVASLDDIEQVLSTYYIYYAQLSDEDRANTQVANMSKYLTSTLNTIGSLIAEQINALSVTDDLGSIDAITNAISLAELKYYYDKIRAVTQALVDANVISDADLAVENVIGRLNVNRLNSLDENYKTMFNSATNDEMAFSPENLEMAYISYQGLIKNGLYAVSDLARPLFDVLSRYAVSQYEELYEEYLRYASGDSLEEKAISAVTSAINDLRTHSSTDDIDVRNHAGALIVGIYQLEEQFSRIRELGIQLRLIDPDPNGDAYDSGDLVSYATLDEVHGTLTDVLNGMAISDGESNPVLTASVITAILQNTTFTSIEESVYELSGARLLLDVYVAAGNSAAALTSYENYNDNKVGPMLSAFITNYISMQEFNKDQLERSELRYVARVKLMYDLFAPTQKTSVINSMNGLLNRYYDEVLGFSLAQEIERIELAVKEAEIAYYSLGPSTRAEVGYAKELLTRAKQDLVTLRMVLSNNTTDNSVFYQTVRAYDLYEEVTSRTEFGGNAIVLDEFLTKMESLRERTSFGEMSIDLIVSEFAASYESTLDVEPLYVAQRYAAIDMYIRCFEPTVSSSSTSTMESIRSTIAAKLVELYYTPIDVLVSGGVDSVNDTQRKSISDAWSVLKMVGYELSLQNALGMDVSYTTPLFTEAQIGNILEYYRILSEYLHDSAITGKDSGFSAEGEHIELTPERITFKNDDGDNVSNVSATNADIQWTNIDNENYTLSNMVTGSANTTNVQAEIVPIPINVIIGTPVREKYYDNETFIFTMDATNHVYTSDGTVADEQGGIDSEAWSKGIASVVRTVNDLGYEVLTPINQLLPGNYFDGIITIIGYDYQGDYIAQVKDASVNPLQPYHVFGVKLLTQDGAMVYDDNGQPIYLRTLDAEGKSNYIITIETDSSENYYANGSEEIYHVVTIDGEPIDYVINKRPIEITYDHLLQSWQDTPQDVTIDSISDPMETPDLTTAQFNTLLKDDQLFVYNSVSGTYSIKTGAIEVINNWIANATNRNHYSKFIGSLDDVDADLYVGFESARNAYNYDINIPVVQLLYLRIADSINYVLEVYNVTDLDHMIEDLDGLYETRHDITYSEGKIPTINQKNDIYCIDATGYVVFLNNTIFEGIYDGKAYTIYNMSLANSGWFAKIEGVFDNGVRIGGIVRNVRIVNGVQIGIREEYNGFIAAKNEGGALENVVVNGYVLGASGSRQNYAGGLFGSAQGGSLGNTTFVGRVEARTTNGAAVAGGIVGVFDADATSTLNNVYTFATVLAVGAEGESNGAGAICGQLSTTEGFTATGVNHLALANSVVEAGESANSFFVNSRAYGNNAGSVGGVTYDELYAGGTAYATAVWNLVNNYMMRDWYLSTGNYSTVVSRVKGNLGTEANPFAVNNWRQLTLFRWMPWLSYTFGGSGMYVPYAVVDMPFAVHKINTNTSFGLYGEDEHECKKITLRSGKGYEGTRRDVLVLGKTIAAIE